MIPLEKQVTCRELSQKLKELGVPQDSVWFWGYVEMTIKWHLYRKSNMFTEDELDVSAFTVAELGMVLPEQCMTFRHKKGWTCSEDLYDHLYFIADTQVNAMATMLIYLLQHNIIKAGDLR